MTFSLESALAFIGGITGPLGLIVAADVPPRRESIRVSLERDYTVSNGPNDEEKEVRVERQMQTLFLAPTAYPARLARDESQLEDPGRDLVEVSVLAVRPRSITPRE
jgi:hypothetical protein